MKKTCVVCGKNFAAQRASALYCSEKCRCVAKGERRSPLAREKKPSRVCVPACQNCFAEQQGKCSILDECLAARPSYGGKCPFYKSTPAYLNELKQLHGGIEIYARLHGPKAWERLQASGMLTVYGEKAPQGRNFG